ncbi:ProFAR isomerase-like protein [Rozella allomycis CSF55]|uniref:ProFAR isomerase-like protein n=1 Tax=Rozella allomycis (strain CSF55) TaxID=988480 RepID=A0A075B321_ROZAC|nr:hypothetical protein O9G_004195 [Rozella allomycis CSF55]RKP16847.1 ProFAR isomerase-like protein [Rozella allomycis CSF55]|eukprot:EPZ35183.1 hypothetical protein O9G_004195 [Rozella allomycis CSF55]
MSLQRTYFNKVASGQKKKEGRTNYGKALKVTVGDRIIFSPNEDKNETLSAVVTGVTNYHSFESMLIKEGIESLLPSMNLTLTEAIQLYQSFPTYLEKEKEFGVRCIQFELV